MWLLMTSEIVIIYTTRFIVHGGSVIATLDDRFESLSQYNSIVPACERNP